MKEHPTPQSIDVQAEMTRLSRMTIQELRNKYRDLYGVPTMVAHKTYLQKRILWKMQEIVEGEGMTAEERRRIMDLSRHSPVKWKPANGKMRKAETPRKRSGPKPHSAIDPLGQCLAPNHTVANVARLVAHAHRIQWMIESGEVNNLALIAERLKMTQARVSQIQDLVLLAPDIKREVLALQTLNDREPLSYRELHKIAREPGWSEQRALWKVCREERGINVEHPAPLVD